LTILDAYALVALLVDEPAADEVEALLRAGDATINAVNLAQALDVAQRVHGESATEVRLVVEPLIGTVLPVRHVADIDAWRAAELRLRHYKRRSSELSLADCLLLAGARDGDRIATADGAILATARVEGIGVVSLPDREGRLPH
jgi:PIN domain nuclease of toxin-antitoxin system